MYITRLASKEIFSPPNKIHREVGRAKDLSAPLYLRGARILTSIQIHGIVGTNSEVHYTGFQARSLM